MRSVTIDVEARFVDNITDESKSASRAVEGIGKAADKAQKDVNNLSKKKAKPIFDADNNKFLNKIRSMEAKMSKMGRTKTAAVFDVIDRATSKIGRIINKAQSFGGRVWQGFLKLNDSAAMSGIRKVTSGMENLTKKTWTALVKVKDMALAPIKAIKNALFSIPTLITAVVTARFVQKAIVQPINLADAYSSAKIGFSTLLGEAEGQAMMDEIDLFAKKTPFKTAGVIANVQKMMAYGWDVNRVIKDMETIGDAAAATGRGDEGLASIVYALSEIRSKGKLSTQELNQLASAGIKAKAYLAEGLGFGTDDAGMKKLAEALEDGAIGANQAINLILEGMKEFDGMMDKTANETVEGLKSQIEDAFEINVFRRWGQGLQDGAKKGLGSIVTLLDNAEESLASFGDMLYELGSEISNWVAKKLEVAVQKIKEITNTDEFKKAGLGGKISMLWNGLIVDPITEWWENGGREKTVKKAGEIGKWIGEALTSGILAILGVTDLLKEGGIDENKGMSVAQSFAKGFVDGFDVSAITDKLVEAIKNVWNALPWWGKALVGSYIGGKVMSGVGGLVGSAQTIFGIGGAASAGAGIAGAGGGGMGLLATLSAIWGSPGNYMVKGSGISGGLASLGYATVGKMTGVGAAGKTGASLAGLSGGGAAAVGAGVIATALSANHVIGSGISAYDNFKAGKVEEGWADVTRAGVTAVGIGGGALIGGKLGASGGSFFGPIGTAAGAVVGAGVGGIIGWLLGDTIADWQLESAIEEKREEVAEGYESAAIRDAITSGEKDDQLDDMVKEEVLRNIENRFGKIKLNMEEIQDLAKNVVWKDDLKHYEAFVASTQEAEANLQSMAASSQAIDKYLWKSGLGLKLSGDEKTAFRQSISDYVAGAKAYLENKHYEFATSAELVLDLNSEGGKSIIASGNAYYAQAESELEAAGRELGNAMANALADGVITADENEAIAAAQAKVSSITNKLSDAMNEAEMETLKMKWGSRNIDADSYSQLVEEVGTQLEGRINATDEAFEIQLANLKIRFPEGGAEYDEQYKDLMKGYNEKLKDIEKQIIDFEMGILSKAYTGLLGSDAKSNLSHALEYALKMGRDPLEIPTSQLIELVGAETLSEEEATEIRSMLSQSFSQLSPIHSSIEFSTSFAIADTEKAIDEIFGALEEQYGSLGGKLSELNAKNEIFGMIDTLEERLGATTEQSATVVWKLIGEKEITKQIDIIAEEFGISDTEAKVIHWMLTGIPTIQKMFNITPSQFGILNQYNAYPNLSVVPRIGLQPQTIKSSSLINLNSTTVSPTITVTPRVLSTPTPVTSGYIQSKGTNGSTGYIKYFTPKYRGGIIGGTSAMEAYALGGRPTDGMLDGTTKFIRVNEEYPEMIIPLSSQRRARAMKLWNKTGSLLGVPGFSRGGMTYGNNDEGLRFQNYGAGEGSGGQTVQVDVGGITFEISVNGDNPQSIAESIKAQADEIAEVVAGVLADALGSQFENTPARGGVA